MPRCRLSSAWYVRRLVVRTEFLAPPRGRRSKETTHGRTAFTLIELLVVIAIIAVLASLLVFVEVNPDSICRPCFGVYMDEGAQMRFLHIPASYHNRSGINTFADGHVEGHKWLDPRTVSPHLPDFHNHNDASPGNVDLLWLRERTTSKRD